MSSKKSSANFKALDPTFGANGDGIVRPYFGAEHGDDILGAAVAPDKKVLVTGQIYESPRRFYIGRLTATGLVDKTFGINGTTVGEFEEHGRYSKGTNITQLSDDRILLSGKFQKQAGDRWYLGLALLDLNGELIGSFGEKGCIVIRPPEVHSPLFAESEPIVGSGPSADSGNSAIELPDGKLLFVSSYQITFEDSKGLLGRLNEDGRVDRSFGEQGFIDVRYGSHSTATMSLMRYNENTLIVAGQFNNNGKYTPMIAMYDTEGNLVESFGDKGFVAIEAISESAQLFSTIALANGTILAIGSTLTEPMKGLLACLDSTGKYNKVFNRGQPLLTSLDEAPGGAQWMSALESEENKIVTLASSLLETNSKTLIAQFTAEGKLDLPFGNNGVLTINPSEVVDEASTITKQGNQVIVSGYSGLIENRMRGFVYRLK